MLERGQVAMSPIDETIEALADTFVSRRFDRATYVATLQGLARIAIESHEVAKVLAMNADFNRVAQIFNESRK